MHILCQSIHSMIKAGNIVFPFKRTFMIHSDEHCHFFSVFNMNHRQNCPTRRFPVSKHCKSTFLVTQRSCVLPNIQVMTFQFKHMPTNPTVIIANTSPKTCWHPWSPYSSSVSIILYQIIDEIMFPVSQSSFYLPSKHLSYECPSSTIVRWQTD